MLGIRVNPLSIDEAIEYTLTLARQKAGCHYVSKLYAEHIYYALKNHQYKEILNNSALALSDGISFVWLSQYLEASQRNMGFFGLIVSLVQIIKGDNVSGKTISNRIGGLDYTLPLLEKASANGMSLFILGSPKQSNIEDSAKYIQRKYPQLKIVGTYDTQNACALLNFSHEFSTVVNTIKKAKPDLTLVCTGLPTQEAICSQLSVRLATGVVIAEGGSLDYTDLGGQLKRAPQVFRSTGLEWAWRLSLEPRRLMRVFRCMKVIFYAYKIKNSINVNLAINKPPEAKIA